MDNLPNNRLKGKVAVVTASTEGLVITFIFPIKLLTLLLCIYSIGLGIVERLAKEGASVVISSRKQSNVDLAVNQFKSQGLKVIGTTCHVAKAEDRTKLFQLVTYAKYDLHFTQETFFRLNLHLEELIF